MHHSKLDEEPGRRGYSGELQGHYRTDRSRTRCPKPGGRGSCPGALSKEAGDRQHVVSGKKMSFGVDAGGRLTFNIKHIKYVIEIQANYRHLTIETQYHYRM